MLKWMLDHAWRASFCWPNGIRTCDLHPRIPLGELLMMWLCYALSLILLKINRGYHGKKHASLHNIMGLPSPPPAECSIHDLDIDNKN